MLLGVPLNNQNKIPRTTWSSVVLTYDYLVSSCMGEWRSTGSPRMGDTFLLILMPNRKEMSQTKLEPLMIGTRLLTSR